MRENAKTSKTCNIIRVNQFFQCNKACLLNIFCFNDITNKEQLDETKQ